MVVILVTPVSAISILELYGSPSFPPPLFKRLWLGKLSIPLLPWSIRIVTKRVPKTERQIASAMVAALLAVASDGNLSPLAAIGACRVGKPSRYKGWLALGGGR